ncbi:hypothetical protein GFM44_33310 [Rhizobium leguminosarum bv. viciae]|jgi:hypothetical protein|nr:hypothetical protein [Rhizobium leguminosarum bv. viciae]
MKPLGPLGFVIIVATDDANMIQKKMPWDRPHGSTAPNRQGDRSAEPIYTALGRALSAWEGVNAAASSLYHALHAHVDQVERDMAIKAFDDLPKTHDRGRMLRQAGVAFTASNFGEMRDEAAKFKRRLKETLGRYVEWVARRNDLAHGYVTEARSPDYSIDEQPIITVYALLPSHARTDRWHHEEPEWNYLAVEIEEFARQFGYLDDALERLASRVTELGPYRTIAE